MYYQVTWMNKETRRRFTGFVQAGSRDDAFDIVSRRLREGYVVTHVYKATGNEITPQSLCINFRAPGYTLFG